MIRKNYKRIKDKLKRILYRKRNAKAFIDFFKMNSMVRGVKKMNKDMISVSFHDFKRPFYARIYPHSDLNVLKQVVLDKEYKCVVDYITDNFTSKTNLIFIDAGGNVGYFSLYIKNYLPDATIACIEPDENNVKVIFKNLGNFIETGEIKVYKNGLGPVSGKFLKIDKNFRGGSDWSLAVSESESETGLKSITVQNIIDDYGWDHVDVLKIDIEGGERFLFTKTASTSYLNKVKFICLEIHDEFDVRDSIYELLTENNFNILNFGETTLAINRKYL